MELCCVQAKPVYKQDVTQSGDTNRRLAVNEYRMQLRALFASSVMQQQMSQLNAK